MPAKIDIENFIEGQYRKYFQYTPNDNCDQQFSGLYRDITHVKMREMFTAFHAELTSLFDQMNSRLPTGDEGAHYWADQSRALIAIIEIVTTLKKELKDTEFTFRIDDYYDGLFTECSKWLSNSGGSLIPPHTEKITLYYMKPIFIAADELLPYQELHELGEQSELLGRGGFGEVYRYHHPIVDIDFAVKIFNPMFATEEDKVEGEKRFFREAKMLFQLNHPNIVRIFDVGRFDGKAFIKIEYVNGKTLEGIRTEHGNFRFKDTVRAARQILSGLQHAHEQGIIHRDLKPTNIMVEMVPGKWTCKIIDFGISAFMDTEGYTKLTRTGEHVAGGNYIDPLLQENPKLRDARSDIYSVGAIMYYLLCGHPPVGGDVERILRESNTALLDKQVEVVLKSLSLDIGKRYSNCDEMKEAIESIERCN